MVLAVNIAVYLALALAIWQAARGAVAALLLVGTNLLSRAVSLAGWPLPVEQMVFLDSMTILIIAGHAVYRGYMMTREVIICALFLLAWRFYTIPTLGWERQDAEMVQFHVLSGVVFCQLMLTLPWRTLIYKMRKTLGFAVGKAPHRLERVAHA